ncbi:MAG: hypothetical protein LBU97_01935 [Alistipes sp.]|nr:hypothetical protein [Alistipes sp.]
MIFVPTEREAAFFSEHGLQVEICGVGMAECAAATARLLADGLSADHGPELVILAGIAGTYTDALSVGDTVVVASETVADMGRRNPDGSFAPFFQKSYAASFVPEGFPVVAANTVSTAGGPVAPTDAEIENMEGAGFFAVCERFGVRAAEVRTVSNRVGEPVTPELLDIAARRLAADLAKIIERL